MIWKPAANLIGDCSIPTVELLGVSSYKCQTQKGVSRRCYKPASVLVKHAGLPSLPMCAACYSFSIKDEKRRGLQTTPPLHELREMEAELRELDEIGR